MFGRKGLNQAAPKPTPARAQDEYSAEGVDGALAILSEALGINLDFDIGYIFSPLLWRDPVCGALLARTGLQPEQAGNKMALLKEAASVAHFLALDPSDPVRKSLEEANFGFVRYNAAASNRFDDGMTQMQMAELRKIAASPATDEGKRYATVNLMMVCSDVMKGKIKVGG